uniref:F-box domain-containing protein n=2 Tax=Oryza TaxID=4527 RepID=A0A0E0QEA9_ORYRU
MKFKKKKGKEKNGWGGDVAFLSGRRRHPETLVVARGTPCASGGEQPRSRLAPQAAFCTRPARLNAPEGLDRASSSIDRDENAPNRFSDLPDELLHHVMSYLTAQQAVQTSVLSRRWQNVWASIKWLKADA